jgi:hypothetical protein
LRVAICGDELREDLSAEPKSYLAASEPISAPALLAEGRRTVLERGDDLGDELIERFTGARDLSRSSAVRRLSFARRSAMRSASAPVTLHCDPLRLTFLPIPEGAVVVALLGMYFGVTSAFFSNRTL